ncbi:hypothetical protein FVO59_00020 [Microbacterium esteraromaticum]|uniref:Uncharacterized protein n=1 Tax=Microbacterium esteraromaticum TaxID=57043 RepID=A0A7D8A964_9MICO|nr:hypothetical protein [Microbacterium esteraromaticum]QMU95764.1 hypothetical protein FVO59_00020 [Microbacterium esteraromaticum]
MILAGLCLTAVGAADLVRRFAARRAVRIALLVVLAAALVAIGILSDAVVPAVIAIVVGAVWVRSMPLDAIGPASFWPAVVLAVLAGATTALMPDRAAPGVIGSVWHLRSPEGEVTFDAAVLCVGVLLVAAESGNLIVRAALDREGTWRPVEAAGRFRGGQLRQPQQAATGFQGGRLIGPLERLLVIALTLAGAYSLLAAMLAAKGIVRFPEISKDGETGARAEYFLVGSLVSWVVALGAAFLLWWGVHS